MSEEPNVQRSPAERQTPSPGRLGQPRLLFAGWHLTLLLVSVIDLTITWMVLEAGGQEVNWIADAILKHTGWPGMVAYKFALVTLFIILCEEIGRRKRPTGRSVAIIGVLISALPMVLVPAQWLLRNGN